MELKKPFKEVKAGDKIYCIKLNDSTIVHDIPSGNPIHEYTIKDIKVISDKEMYITFMQGGGEYLISVDPIAYLKCVDTKVEDEYDLAINRIIYSPSKQRIRDYMLWVFNVNEMKVNDIKEKCLTLLRRMENAKGELSEIKDDKESDIIDLIDAATMAL